MIPEDKISDNLRMLTENILDTWHFRVHNAFNLVNSPGWHIPTRKIEDWMLVYARGGRGYYEIENSKHPIEEGRLFLISHDLSHSAAQEEQFPASVIALRFGIYQNCNGESVMKELSPIGLSCMANRFSYTQQLFENIYQYFKLYPGKFGMSLSHALLSQIFNSLCLKMLHENKSVNEDYRLKEAKLYIEENVLEELPLQKVAEHVQMSAKYFSKLFRRQYGISFKTCVFLAKMNYGRFLLEETDYPLKRIAEMLGYSDQYIFSNQFRKVNGVSPSKVRHKRQ